MFVSVGSSSPPFIALVSSGDNGVILISLAALIDLIVSFFIEKLIKGLTKISPPISARQCQALKHIKAHFKAIVKTDLGEKNTSKLRPSSLP